MHNAFCQCVCFFTCNDRDYGKYGEREELFLRYAGLHFLFLFFGRCDDCGLLVYIVVVVAAGGDCWAHEE